MLDASRTSCTKLFESDFSVSNVILAENDFAVQTELRNFCVTLRRLECICFDHFYRFPVAHIMYEAVVTQFLIARCCDVAETFWDETGLA